jgi:hypothetical protein
MTANLRTLTKEKRELQMKRHLLPTTTFAAILVLVLLVPAIAFSQTPPGGAQLRITGTVGSSTRLINVAINDGQITSSLSRTSPCDGMTTNAYVLQGGSPTGCDNGDVFETTQGTGSATLQGTGFNFAVTTLYCITKAKLQELKCVSSTNSNGTVQANPDTGFLTVTNNSGAAFTGSITLTGTSPVQASTSASCPPIGLASDSFFGTLAAGGTRTFALSSDSSDCGGFTPPLTLPLTAGNGVTSYTYPVGQSIVDKYVITPLNNVGGENLTITPVLVRRTNTTPPPTPFSAGGMFPSTTTCAPYDDFTDAGPDVCVEFQSTCDDSALPLASQDCGGTNPFFYNLAIHYNLASSFSVVGGVSLLKAEGSGCPTSGFNKNILTGYSASNDPLPTGGTGGHSCFVSAFDPTVSGVVNEYQTFVGFQSPVSNSTTNIVNSGSSVPLTWQQFQIDSTGGVGPNTTMTLCSTSPCTDNTLIVAAYPIRCPGSPNALTNSFPGGSSLQNFGGGSYQFNLQTVKGSKGCFKVALSYGSGAVELPSALFQFK